MFGYWLLHLFLVYTNSFLNFKFGTPIKKVDKSFNISGNSYKQRQLLKNINGLRDDRSRCQHKRVTCLSYLQVMVNTRVFFNKQDFIFVNIS